MESNINVKMRIMWICLLTVRCYDFFVQESIHLSLLLQVIVLGKKLSERHFSLEYRGRFSKLLELKSETYLKNVPRQWWWSSDRLLTLCLWEKVCRLSNMSSFHHHHKAVYMILDNVNAGKWGLERSSPNMVKMIHFSFNLTCVKTKYDKVSATFWSNTVSQPFIQNLCQWSIWVPLEVWREYES